MSYYETPFTVTEEIAEWGRSLAFDVDLSRLGELLPTAAGGGRLLVYLDVQRQRRKSLDPINFVAGVTITPHQSEDYVLTERLLLFDWSQADSQGNATFSHLSFCYDHRRRTPSSAGEEAVMCAVRFFWHGGHSDDPHYNGGWQQAYAWFDAAIKPPEY